MQENREKAKRKQNGKGRLVSIQSASQVSGALHQLLVLVLLHLQLALSLYRDGVHLSLAALAFQD